MRILIIEAGDAKPGFAGFALQQVFGKRYKRHEVILVKELASVQPLVGLTSATDQLPIALPIDLAIVDGLDGETPSGPDIVRTLKQLGIPCIANAAMDTANDALLAAGANVVAKRKSLLAAVYYRRVRFADVARQPCRVQRRLDRFRKRYEHDEKLRHRVEVIARKCLLQR